MCGIGGILRTDGQPIPEEWLDAIDARIAWRGPDGQGRFRDRVEVTDENGQKRTVEVAFVHRRLSIIDHAGGAQPMVSQRGRDEKEGLVAVVFNGCIYNHRELRRELEGKGHRFVTDHSDTEVLIHGWREWGMHLIEHIEGMYALGLWDRALASMLMARDWFGEKPLFYPSTPNFEGDPEMFAFASVVKPILDVWRGQYSVWKSKSPWHQEQDFLRTGYSTTLAMSADNTGVLTHPPGIALVVQASKKPLMKDCSARPRSWPAANTAMAELESLIDRAVARRLDADVPLGCFLSGGVDSSLVAFFAKRHKHDLRTFTVRMPDDRFDESPHADRVARHLDLDHSTIDVAIEPAQDLIMLVTLLGQPFGDSSILPTYWVSKAARQHVKVALSGDGGDELFVGYERYLAAPFLARNWRWLRHLPVSPFHRFHSKSRLNKIARLRDMARDFPSIGLSSMESVFTVREIDELTNRASNGAGRYKPEEDPVRALRQYDVDRYLPNDLLRKVDTASMACGLEVRCPFLDRDLARAALSMPIDQLIPGGQRKGLLRQIARKYLPKEIVDRPKMGFAIPIGEWFRTDYGGMKTLLLDHLNSAEPFGPVSLNRKAVQKFVDQHMNGKRDHGQRLFTLLTLSIWARGLKEG